MFQEFKVWLNYQLTFPFTGAWALTPNWRESSKQKLKYEKFRDITNEFQKVVLKCEIKDVFYTT